MRAKLSKAIQDAWYQGHPLLWFLLPLSFLFAFLSDYRRRLYVSGKKVVLDLPGPVIVVGNITVGGTGKSPLVIWLVEKLKMAGYHPGVVSRGYGGRAPCYPFFVDHQSTALESGDEPWMIQRRTGVPCMVDPDRARAAEALFRYHGCDVIVSDDGLQHYRLPRAIEIVVIDGQRGLGNGFCLPAGPLREPAKRLHSVDYVVVNGGATQEGAYSMQLQSRALYRLDDLNNTEKQAEPMVHGESVHAVAGIGNPQRFFDTLRALGYQIQPHPFADHHAFSATDLCFNDEKKIIMTEKDAVKCFTLNKTKAYYLSVEAQVDEALWLGIEHQLARISHSHTEKERQS